MTALILYDTFTLASKANTLLQRASAKADGSLDWKVIPWRTHLLRSASFTELALAEAADAHLIICAWRDSHPFHHWTESWLVQWNSCRKVHDAAIALVSENDDTVQMGAAMELSRFAERHGLPLIIAQRAAPERSNSNVMSTAGLGRAWGAEASSPTHDDKMSG
jgi:hypothetical protein